MEMSPEKMKVSMLQALLTEKGLNSKGNKASLVERLQAALVEEAKDEERDGENNKEEPDPEEAVADGGSFDGQSFVSNKSEGVSFNIHAPTPKKPEPTVEKAKEALKEPSQQPSRTASAADFFAGGNDASTEESMAKVPLPPSSGYNLDSEEEDDVEQAPGTELPDVNKKDEKPQSVEDSWRPLSVDYTPVEVSSWKAGVEGGLQDPALFLMKEAEMVGEPLSWEIEDKDGVPGLVPTSVKIQIRSFNNTVSVEDETEAKAINNVSLKMLKMTGPWVHDADWEQVTTSINAALPMANMSWLPPLYNVDHISTVDLNTGATWVGEIPGRSLYRVTIILGPLTFQAVGTALSDTATSLSTHVKTFLRTRDLTKLTADKGESSGEIYVKGQDIINIMMEAGEGKSTSVLPPLDLSILQPKMFGGRIPPGYECRDEYGCVKLFLCQLCSSKVSGSHKELLQHVSSPRHQARLGRVIVDGVTIEEFRPSGKPHIPRSDVEDAAEIEKFAVHICTACEEDGSLEVAVGRCKECTDYLCGPCKEAHGKTRITKNHTIDELPEAIVHHPRKDAAEGREVKGDSEGYLVRIYRCGTIAGKEQAVAKARVSRFGPIETGPNQLSQMAGGPPGFHPSNMAAGPPTSNSGNDANAESATPPVKKGLVNDPLAGINSSGPNMPQFPPGQWGPMGPMPGPMGPGGPPMGMPPQGWGGGGPFNGPPGGPGGPPGPWGPRPPFPPGMVCVSQGNSGKQCWHFQKGTCTYGNRCIHLHLVPAGAAPPMQQQHHHQQQGQEEDSDSEEEESEEEDQQQEENKTDAPAEATSAIAVIDKKAAAKQAAVEEAMRAAKIAAAKAGDIPESALENLNAPGKTNAQRHMMMHAFSVGQKSKKKDPKPEEQRAGDWACSCGNYNFSWRKRCNACNEEKPFSEAENESKQKELERIKADRARRRAEAATGGGQDLREKMDRNRAANGGGGGNGGRRGKDSRDRGRDDEGNANLVPLGRRQNERGRDNDQRSFRDNRSGNMDHRSERRDYDQRHQDRSSAKRHHGDRADERRHHGDRTDSRRHHERMDDRGHGESSRMDDRRGPSRMEDRRHGESSRIEDRRHREASRPEDNRQRDRSRTEDRRHGELERGRSSHDRGRREDEYDHHRGGGGGFNPEFQDEMSFNSQSKDDDEYSREKRKKSKSSKHSEDRPDIGKKHKKDKRKGRDGEEGGEKKEKKKKRDKGEKKSDKKRLKREERGSWEEGELGEYSQEWQQQSKRARYDDHDDRR